MNKHPSRRLSPGLLLLLPLLCLCNPVHGTVYHLQAALTGSAEVPSNASPGTGIAHVYMDDVAQTMHVNVWFEDLMGVVTGAHIHGATPMANTGTAGVATQTPTFSGFPSGVTAGSYDQLFDMTLASSFNANYITANGGTAATAFQALLAAMLEEKTYFNIHTDSFRGGEIRGFLHVPDTASTALLLGLGITAMAALNRVRRPRC